MDFRLVILFGITMIVSLFAQSYVKSSYQKYSRIGTFRGMTGAQVAQYILDRNNLHDVTVIESRGGVLSDHFDPMKNTVALSKDVYHSASIASVAVAAHEVGHAIQYATGYHGIKVRNILLKPTLVASQFSQVALIIGLITSSFFLELGIIMLAVIVLFQ
ncbi:MAG TPA: zinc metallopeptidase, partial [Erysipelothrix sp.]|nr:zinc metallopeptidase [Erysipelothrix sp.]